MGHVAPMSRLDEDEDDDLPSPQAPAFDRPAGGMPWSQGGAEVKTYTKILEPRREVEHQVRLIGPSGALPSAGIRVGGSTPSTGRFGSDRCATTVALQAIATKLVYFARPAAFCGSRFVEIVRRVAQLYSG